MPGFTSVRGIDEAVLLLPRTARRLGADSADLWCGGWLSIEQVWHGGSRLRQAFRAHSLRPAARSWLNDHGSAISDVCRILASIAGCARVTTNLSINFLRKPAQRDLVAECKLLKLGTLAVGEVTIRSEGEDAPSPMSPRLIHSRQAGVIEGSIEPLFKLLILRR